MPTSVSLSSLLPPTLIVAALVSWLIYECSDTVEQSVIPGGSKDERLTDVYTHILLHMQSCSISRFLRGSPAFINVCPSLHLSDPLSEVNEMLTVHPNKES